jgi:hypothetical protein
MVLLFPPIDNITMIECEFIDLYKEHLLSFQCSVTWVSIRTLIKTCVCHVILDITRNPEETWPVLDVQMDF